MGYAKVKKEERKVLKNGHKSVQNSENNGYARLKKRKKRKRK
jgi:hypothetical protein